MRVVGVDGLLTPKGWVTVSLRDGQLQAIRLVTELKDLLLEQQGADVIGVNLPLAHDDPEGEKDGRRACDQAAKRLLADHADLVEDVPPWRVFSMQDLEAARSLCAQNDWPEPSEAHWRARARILSSHEAARGDKRFVEIHPEVTFTALLEGLQGPGARLKRRPRSWPGQHERLSLLHVAGLRPMRSFGGVGRSSPEDVLAATAAAWSAHRHAVGNSQSLPSEPRPGQALIRY